ncbi:MAG: GNAT family N-acetyltransferase [bacterium]|nr:GNAT family N-acetyltransferase [bacterium]
MSITLTEVTLSDQVEQSLSRLAERFRNVYPFYDEWCKEVYLDIQNGSRSLYDIQLANDAIGLLLINKSKKSIIKINTIYVYPPYQHMGFGSQAINIFLDKFAGNAEFIFIQCKEENIAANKLIKATGFVFIGFLHHTIEQARDNLIFVKIKKENVSLDSAIAAANQVYSLSGRKKFLPTKL